MINTRRSPSVTGRRAHATHSLPHRRPITTEPPRPAVTSTNCSNLETRHEWPVERQELLIIWTLLLASYGRLVTRPSRRLRLFSSLHKIKYKILLQNFSMFWIGNKKEEIFNGITRKTNITFDRYHINQYTQEYHLVIIGFRTSATTPLHVALLGTGLL